MSNYVPKKKQQQKKKLSSSAPWYHHNYFTQSRTVDVFPKQVVTGLTACQMVMCITSSVIQFFVLGLDAPYSEVNAGLWAGVSFGLAALFGIYAVFNATEYRIITFMVLSILAAILAVNLCVMSGFAISVSLSCLQQKETDHQLGHCSSYPTVSLILYGILAALAVTEVTVAVTSSLLCCRGLCHTSRAREQEERETAAVLYDPQSFETQGATVVGEGSGLQLEESPYGGQVLPNGLGPPRGYSPPPISMWSLTFELEENGVKYQATYL